MIEPYIWPHMTILSSIAQKKTNCISIQSLLMKIVSSVERLKNYWLFETDFLFLFLFQHEEFDMNNFLTEFEKAKLIIPMT